MKKVVLLIAGLFLSFLVITSCSSSKEVVKIENQKNGSYVGQYDEKMTPDNSVVICIKMNDMDRGSVTFKQINPKFEPDEQTYTYSGGDTIIFKPCKPGAKYMVTKTKGKRIYYMASKIVYEWDVELRPNQQYYTVEAPKKPGLYFFDDDSLFLLAFYLSEDYTKVKDITPDSKGVSFEQLWKKQADLCYSKGNTGLLLSERDSPEEDVKKNLEEYHIYYWTVWESVQNDYKELNKANQKFADYYFGTPWYDVFYKYVQEEKEYLDKANQVLEDYKKNNDVPCCSL